MAEYNSVNLGRIMPKYTGDYSTNVNYNTLDIVFYEGSSYIATQPSLRQTPAIDSEYWGLISGKGDKGDKGDTGATGPKGDKGDTGPAGKDAEMPVIGGRNYLLNTADYSKNWSWSVKPSIDGSQVPNILHYPKTTMSSGMKDIANQVISDGILQPSTTYTASFYAKGTGTVLFYCFPNVAVGSYDKRTYITLSSNFKRYTITFTTVSDLHDNKNLLIRQDFSSTATDQNTVEAYIYGLKLEKGNIPTDWTPAPEDVPSNNEQLVHKTGNETIAGDKTFTGKLSATNLNISGDMPNTVLTYNSGFSGGASYYFVRNKTVHMFLLNVKGFTASSQRPFEVPSGLTTSVPGPTYFVGMYGTSTALVGFNGTQVYISTSSVAYNADTPLNVHLTWQLP